jgi:hypothetical protein
MGKVYSTHGDKRNACRVLMGKLDGKRPRRRSKRKREDNIKMDLREIRCDDMVWIRLTQDRDQWQAVVNTVMNFRVSITYLKIVE